MGEDSKARVVEEMTDEGQVYRLEVGNKGGRCFSCVEVGHMAGFCPRNAWSKNRKNGFKGEVWGGVEEGVLDVEKVVSVAESWVTRQYHVRN